jgi:hypothetical protein
MQGATVQHSIAADTMVLASKEQVSCDLAGETAILNVQSGVYYGLDEVGARIWELIQTPQRVSDVRDSLLNEYDVEPSQCEADLIALLSQLSEVGLVEVQA